VYDDAAPREAALREHPAPKDAPPKSQPPRYRRAFPEQTAEAMALQQRLEGRRG